LPVGTFEGIFHPSCGYIGKRLPDETD
jgi:hypothetical protein